MPACFVFETGTLLVHFLPKIDSARLRRHVDACDNLQCSKIDHFNRAWIGGDAFNGNEGVTVVRRNRDAMNDFSLGCKPRQFFAGRYVEYGHGLIAAIRRNQFAPVGRHAEIVDAGACWNTPDQFPGIAIDLNDVARTIARDKDR